MFKDWKFLIEAHRFSDFPQDEIPEFVFWGRSNVGKSSLINSVTRTKIAKISKTPGRTRSLNFFELERKFRIVDFPGYGFSKIPKKNELKLDRLIDLYIKKRKNISKFLLLIDSMHGFKPIDKIIMDQLDFYLQKKVFIIFTKKDRIKNQIQKEILKKSNEFAEKKLNKKFFNTSIKEANTIILLQKFLTNSLSK